MEFPPLAAPSKGTAVVPLAGECVSRLCHLYGGTAQPPLGTRSPFFSGSGAPTSLIAADIVRIENGVLAEHWDLLQDEVTQEQSKSGKPMFGDSFPVRS
jgi:hypothetical protein